MKRMPAEEPAYYTPREAAAILKTPMQNVYMLIWSGTLKAESIDGRWHIAPDALADYIEARNARKHAQAARLEIRRQAEAEQAERDARRREAVRT